MGGFNSTLSMAGTCAAAIGSVGSSAPKTAGAGGSEERT
jgi:hypothetical protein